MKELAKTLATEFHDKEYAHAYVNQFYDMAIAAQIKAIRELRGLSQEELASAAHMRQERISVLENVDYDAWTLKTLRKLGDAFDVAVKVSFVGFSDAIVDVVNLRLEKLELASREVSLKNFSTEHLVINLDGDWQQCGKLAQTRQASPPKPIELSDDMDGKWESFGPILVGAGAG